MAVPFDYRTIPSKSAKLWLRQDLRQATPYEMIRILYHDTMNRVSSTAVHAVEDRCPTKQPHHEVGQSGHFPLPMKLRAQLPLSHTPTHSLLLIYNKDQYQHHSAAIVSFAPNSSQLIAFSLFGSAPFLVTAAEKKKEQENKKRKAKLPNGTAASARIYPGSFCGPYLCQGRCQR